MNARSDSPGRRTGPRLAPGAVGVGFRPELAADLLAAPATADLVEVVAETCYVQPQARREALALAEIWPVIPHGVKLSLGSADGLDRERAQKLGALARELRAPAISEHVALTRAGRREIGHLTALPFTREAVRVVARNVAAARRWLPDVPLLLENIAWTLRWPEDALAEGDFYAEIVEATGCELLLDVANLYANARNRGQDPFALLAAYPLERVGMIHLAGGALQNGFYLDSHAAPVPDPVFELLAAATARAGAVPVILERDAQFGSFDALVAELQRARAIVRAASHDHVAASDRLARALAGPASESELLCRRQAALAEVLTASPAPATAAGFSPQELARTRAILQHKRVDDALPLLRHASRGGERLRALAFDALRGTPHAAAGGGIADALRIADAAAQDPSLSALARLDRLELRSRFTRPGAPRRWPFVGHERLPDGRRAWAFKGPGRGAPVHLYQPGGGR